VTREVGVPHLGLGSPASIDGLSRGALL
jgi:hypothetical protein